MPLKHITILSLLFLVYSCSGPKTKAPQYEAQAPVKRDSVIQLDVKKKKLANGLTILLVKNDKLPIYSYYTFVKVGGKNEVPGITGASHYLEHMMFRGAKKYGLGQFDRMIEGNGGSSNAFTTLDLTVYHENLPKESFNTIVDMEADRMANLLLEEGAFERERNVILEERKMRYENSPRGQMFLNMMEKVFAGTPYASPVIGSIPDIKNVTRDQMQDYFKTFYAPNNLVLVIVGDIDVDQTFKLIEKKYGSIPASDKVVQKKLEREADEIYKVKSKWGRSYNMYGQSPRPIFSLAFLSEKIGTRKSYALDILSSIIGAGDSSYLSQEFIYAKRPYLSNVYSYNYTLQHSGILVIGGMITPGISPKKLERKLRKSVRKMCKKSLTARSLEKTKNQYMIDYFSSLDTNAGIASFVGHREVYFNDPYHYEKEINIYQSIELEEVKQACNDLVNGPKPIFLSIWKKNKKRK